VNNINPKTLGYLPDDLRTQVVVKFKKLVPEAVIPQYANLGDAGLDLTCIGLDEMELTPSGNKITVIKTGLAIEMPAGYAGFLFPRSSIANKDWRLTNCVGIIDSGYRGEIRGKFDVIGGTRPMLEGSYKAGERCLQLIVMPIPYVHVVEVLELSESDRGEGGFGSTG